MPDNQDSGQGQGNQDQGGEDAAAAAAGKGDQGAADQGAAAAAAAAAAKAAAPADFKGQLPEEYRADPAADKFKNTGELFKSYKELEKLVGLEKLPIPKKDKDGKFEAEGVKGVMQRLGMPKDPGGYDLSKINAPEGMPELAGQRDGLKAEFHKLNLLPGQAEGITKMMFDYVSRGQAELAKKTEAERVSVNTSLREKWGAAYDNKIAGAKKLFNKYASPEDKAHIDKGLGNDMVLIKIMANIATDMSEGTLDTEGIKDTVMTPEDAQKEISSIRNDKNNPLHAVLMNNLHPEHAKVVEKLNDLYAMAHPAQ